MTKEKDRAGTLGPVKGMHYVVMGYGGVIVYRGENETLAAHSLNPGTVYGADPKPVRAFSEAKARSMTAKKWRAVSGSGA